MEKQQKRAVKKKAKKTAQKAVRRMGLADASPYLRSLLDPYNEWGAKVPDSMTAPSFVVHCIHRQQQPIGSGGAGPNCSGVLLAVGDLGAAGASTSFVLAGSATAGQLSSAAFEKSYAAQIKSTTQARRLVSAGLYASYQGSPLNAKGRISVAFIPATTPATLPPLDLNNDVLTQSYLATFPASVGFAKTLWLPLDPLARSYMSGPTASLRGISGSAAMGPGFLLILVDGGTSGDIIEFTIVENYECLPLQNSVSWATPTPSKSDPIELAAVDNFVSATPNLTVQQDVKDTMNKTAAIQSQTTMVAAHSQKHESGFLDKLLHGAGKLVDFGMDYGPKIAAGLGYGLAAL